jgi:DNA-binding NarL/FixJ family response regulator
MVMNGFKAILIEDNEIYRQSLKNVLEKEFNISVIAEFSNGKEFMDFEDKRNADVVFMDLEMPEMDGFIAAKRTLWVDTNVKFIAVSAHTDHKYMWKVVESGFKGYIHKHNIFNELNEAVFSVLSGNYYFTSLSKFIN